MACRKIKAKQELIRLVRISDKNVEVDIGGKKAGRGAYLCLAQECWEVGVRGGKLEHSLKIILAQDDQEQLIRFGEDLFKGVG